jgi:hypothetical protein
MNRRTFYIAVIIAAVLGAVFLWPFAWRRVEDFATSVHQRGVTIELATWETEYGHVQSWEEARRSIGMLEYVQRYYVPGPGYRSDGETEERLESQRARTMQAIVAGLREFTGQDFGVDADRWRVWAEEARAVPHKTK